MLASVVLVGPPGAGKTAVGELVASRLGLPFVDADALLAQRSGASAGDVLISHGQDEFRAAVFAANEEAIERGGVVASSSSAVLDPRWAQITSGGTVIFLDVDVARSTARLGMNSQGPGPLAGMRGTMLQQFAQRRPFYEASADVVVNTIGRDLDEVAAEVQEIVARVFALDPSSG